MERRERERDSGYYRDYPPRDAAPRYPPSAARDDYPPAPPARARSRSPYRNGAAPYARESGYSSRDAYREPPYTREPPREPRVPREPYRDARDAPRDYPSRGHRDDYRREERYDRDRYDDRRGYDDRYDRRGPDRGYDRYDRGGPGRREDLDRRVPRRLKPIDRGADDERSTTTSLYVGNLPYAFVEQDVQEMFERFGALRKITVPLDQFTGKNRGFAFVEFEIRAEAQDALDKYSGYTVEGRRLKVDWDPGRERKQDRRGGGQPTDERGPPIDDAYSREPLPEREDVGM